MMPSNEPKATSTTGETPPTPPAGKPAVKAAAAKEADAGKKTKAKPVMPEAELLPRASDLELSEAFCERLSLFQGKKSGLGQYPGSYRVRLFRKGELICQQGAEEYTAYYILNAQDERVLVEFCRTKSPNQPAQRWDASGSNRLDQPLSIGDHAAILDAICHEHEALARLSELGDLAETELRLELKGGKLKAEWSERMAEALERLPSAKRELAERIQTTWPALANHLRAMADRDDARCAAMVHVEAEGERRGPKSFWARLFGRPVDPARGGRRTLTVDAPVQLPRDEPVGMLYPEEIFGEMSCRNRKPRAATIMAARDCYLFEMRRIIFDNLMKDAQFKAKLEDNYRKRVLATALRESPLFANLEPQLLEEVREQLELVEYEPGSLLFAENDAADCMYLIRSGIVKVVKDVSPLVAEHEIVDAAALARFLQETAPKEIHAENSKSTDGVAHSGGLRQDLAAELNRRLKDPHLCFHSSIRKRVLETALPQRIWAHLAAASESSAASRRRCNRFILVHLLAGALKEPSKERIESQEILAADIDPKKLTVVQQQLSPNGPLAWLRARMSLESCAAIDADPLSAEALAAVLHQVLDDVPLLLAAEVQPTLNDALQRKLQTFLPKGNYWTDEGDLARAGGLWSGADFARWNGNLNRLAVEACCPGALRGLDLRRPAWILAYRSRGEFVGEMGLLDTAPRSASCIAYNHPTDTPGRKAGPVELMRIPRELFVRLQQTSPSFVAAVRREAESRKQANLSGRTSQALATSLNLATAEAAERGLIEGRQLMLIDLDRCTRCDECVQACAATHDDGRIRLYLDGPRYGHYLIPTTCRSCLDPLCMIGCPVDAIHRGGNGQINIEDWCIGCGKCASQCPYGSIQMHDGGILPRRYLGWRCHAHAALPERWYTKAFNDHGWPVQGSPFTWSRSFREQLGVSAPDSAVRLGFRAKFTLNRKQRLRDRQFLLRITNVPDPKRMAVSLNGVFLYDGLGDAVRGEEIAAQLAGRAEIEIKRSFEASLHANDQGKSLLGEGENLLAIQLEGPFAEESPLLEARIDETHKLSWNADVDIKVVDEYAVVCDLCSNLRSGPACVSACPHEAAVRVNAAAQVGIDQAAIFRA